MKWDNTVQVQEKPTVAHVKISDPNGKNIYDQKLTLTNVQFDKTTGTWSGNFDDNAWKTPDPPIVGSYTISVQALGPGDTPIPELVNSQMFTVGPQG